MAWKAFAIAAAFFLEVGAAQTTAARRIALVVGNKDYQRSQWTLANPGNDARSMEDALKATGFEVHLLVNATLIEMRNAVDDLVKTTRPRDVVLFYYAGHGIQLYGENYLIPVDFTAADERSAREQAFNVDTIRTKLERTSSALRILILDTCRNNPFRPNRSLDNSLANMSSGEGTFIALATGPGAVASDGGDGRNGLFTGFLVEALKTPALSLDEVFATVRKRVKDATGGSQWPLVVNAVVGTFYFRPVGVQINPDPVPVAAVVAPIASRATSSLPPVTPDQAKLADDLVKEADRLIASRSYADAITILERAKSANSGSADVHRALAKALFSIRSYSKAEQAYNEAIRLRSDSAELYRDRGVCRSEMRSYSLAVADLSEAIRLNPNDWQSYWFRSQARFALGDEKGGTADDLEVKSIRRRKTP